MWEIFETSVAGNERQSSSRRIGRCKYGASCENVHFGRQEYSQISAMLIMLVFMHHGQICYGTERIIIMESIADNFISVGLQGSCILILDPDRFDLTVGSRRRLFS
jgi:hypothetical protein